MRLHRTTSSSWAIRIIKVGLVTYISKALPGTHESSPTWQIMKIDKTSGSTIISWADGDDAFDNVSTNPALLTYS